ncbi:hypothetical protein HU200_049153 [Digitaria exilis]|uniref:non-specific serine/threonine protein kinase n=1 Tax=Digitaria exilis TaxID=1010633 RepID=A0A835E8R7_9POAL|nr:hypothetical protein HU200_049153 [Digitaria exilis]
MADIALGSVEKIVKIALKIKEAMQTVKQNEKECRDIQRCVARVSALIKRLDETTETMKDKVMRDALEDMAESLQRALEFVTECQTGDMAKELSRVQDDIVRKLQLGNFATNVQTTIMVSNIQASGAPDHPSPTTQPRREVIDGRESKACYLYHCLQQLKGATRDFSEENIIGRGGSATVYKQDSLYDAINIFIDLNHKNILRPLGYSHEIVMVLVSNNGKYISAPEERFWTRLINWSSRFKVIQGIAQGLHYLHEKGVLHLDLKPSNILLDSHMNARINDFGVAKMLDHGDVEICVNFLVGTLSRGYIAPEHLSHGVLSAKNDVYAFGITLLRTISTMCISEHPGARGSAAWAWEARVAVRMELFDLSLCDKSQLIQIKRCMEIGLLCVETDRTDRPTMEEVLAMLNGEKGLPALKRPFGV